MNDVVVGVDRSETAERAAKVAAGLAAAYGVNLHIVTSAHPTESVHGGVGSDQFDTDWLGDAELFVKGLAKSLPHDRISISVQTGDPATVMCDEAERLGASTIVVGNRRVQGVARLLGSIASDVLKKAPCNVLIAQTRK